MDGEGCFTLNVSKNNELSTGWRVQPVFKIGLHSKDLDILKSIQEFFGVGKIYKQNSESNQYLVSTVKDLATIIEHLNKYPLLTKKHEDFLLFKQGSFAPEIIKFNEHLTPEGLGKIVSIRASLNQGLTETLEKAFPDVVPVSRPIVNENKEIKSSNWVSGFTSAGAKLGCFYITQKTKGGKTYVGLKFQITQHVRDEQLMRSLIPYLGCGRYEKSGENVVNYICTKISDLNEKIMPFFSRFPILGVKSLDFADWCKAMEIIKTKASLTTEGLNQIQQIKAGMNKGRK